MKLCSKCKEIKPLTEYHLDSSKKKGVRSSCKICMNTTNRKGMKESLHVLMVDRYHKQVYNSKQRNHPVPSYSLEEFILWVDNQGNASQLYDNWKSSNYLKSLAPSVDRINSLLPYTLDNLRLTTWQINNKNNHEDMSKGISSPSALPIIAYNKKGEPECSFTSISHASKELNIPYSSLYDALNRKNNKYVGLYWRYV